MDTLATFGGSVKSLGDRKIGGYLVLFSDADSPDLDGDYFDATTDFDMEDGDARSGYYSHGLDLTVKNRKIGKGTLKTDEVGVWLEGVIAERDEYCDAILKLVEKGDLGLSSGALTHLVRREEVKSGVSHVTHWPIGEWSLTPTPAEPRTKALALKSVQSLEELLKKDEKQATGDEHTVKGLLSEYAPEQMTMAALRSLNDTLFYSVLWEILYDEELTSEDRAAKLNAAFDEFRDLAVAAVTAFLAEPATSAEMKTTLRHLWGNPPAKTLTERTAALVSEAAELTSEWESHREVRAKDGRPLSAADRENGSAAHASVKELAAKLEAVLAQAPTPSLSAQRLRMRLQATLALQSVS